VIKLVTTMLSLKDEQIANNILIQGILQ
jgi:hypothetical protein